MPRRHRPVGGLRSGTSKNEAVVVDGQNGRSLGISVEFALTDAVFVVILLDESTDFLGGSGPLGGIQRR